MAYSELIKNFANIRDYMRQFYVFGFRQRCKYTAKSARSYDNERRRLESWLGEYMSFSRNSEGKSVFLTVDSRSAAHNPLYKAFKAKSFTNGDIVFHFYILDMLAGGEVYTVREIMDKLDDYLSAFDNVEVIDESSVRKKLREYEQLGIIKSEKRGREKVYSRRESCLDLNTWTDALAYFSEVDPLGVIGSFLLDKLPAISDDFAFKHHYILFAIDSQVLLNAVMAINEHRGIEIRLTKGMHHYAYPVKVYISVQNGRQYLCCYDYKLKKPFFFRLDNIKEIVIGGIEKNYKKYETFYDNLQKHLWGVSTGIEYTLEHIEFTLRVYPDEMHIVHRLEREKRVGSVVREDETLWKFSADVYDPREMLPWIRTFIGRIENLTSTDKYVEKLFYEDLQIMRELYGGGESVV